MPVPSQWTLDLVDAGDVTAIAAWLLAAGIPTDVVPTPQTITYRSSTLQSLSIRLLLFDSAGDAIINPEFEVQASEWTDWNQPDDDPGVPVECLHSWGPPDGTGEGATRTCLISGEVQTLTWS